MRAGVLFLGCLLGLFDTTPLGAQTSDSPLGFVSGRVGLNAQAVPDGVSGTSLGGGASLALFVGSRWAIEFEAWIPGEISDPSIRNRVPLYSVSAVRFFNDAGRGPYMVFGLTAAAVEFGSSSDVAGGLQLGGGSVIRLGTRTSVAPELRVNVIDGGAIIIRPNIALLYTFP